jgi:hypothetical protein
MISPAALDWSVVQDDAIARWRGALGATIILTLSPERLRLLNESIGSVSESPPTPNAAWDMADVCPDPLVFAIGTGLPRLRILAAQIDGGSEWETFQSIGPGRVTLVSRISGIHGKVTSRGRRMMRTTYEVAGYLPNGHPVGVARGFSLDVAAPEDVSA